MLRTEPKKHFKDIVDRFDLAKQAEDGSTVKILRMAGYRGPSGIPPERRAPRTRR